MARKKTEEKKTNSEKLARQAGKVAAKAERSASEAVDRAKALTTYVAGFFGKPIGAAVHAGQETIEQLSSGVSHLLGAEGVAATAENALEDVKDAVEARVQSIVRELGLPTREDYEALGKRVAALEAAAAKPRAARKPVSKPSAKPAAKSAAKPAAKAPRVRATVKPAGAK
jgi:hypothetical protein